jgi:hypothetical protein
MCRLSIAIPLVVAVLVASEELNNGKWEKGEFEEDFNVNMNIKPMTIHAIAYDLELNPTGGSGMLVNLRFTNREQTTPQRMSIAFVKVQGVPASGLLKHVMREKATAMTTTRGISDKYPTTDSCFRDMELSFMADGPLGPMVQMLELVGGGEANVQHFFRTDPALGDGTFVLLISRCESVRSSDDDTWISVVGKAEWVPDWHINNKTWHTFFMWHFLVNGAILLYGIYCWYHFHEDELCEPEPSKPTPLPTVAPIPASGGMSALPGSLSAPDANTAEAGLLGSVTSAPGAVDASASNSAPDPAAEMNGEWQLTVCTVGYAGFTLLMKGCLLLKLLPGYEYVSSRVFAFLPCIGQDGRCSCEREQVGASTTRARARGGVDCCDCAKAFAVACCCPVFALANVNSTAKLHTWPGTRWTANVFFYAALFFGTSFALLLRYQIEESYFKTLYNVKVHSTFRVALDNVLRLLNLIAVMFYAALCYSIARYTRALDLALFCIYSSRTPAKPLPTILLNPCPPFRQGPCRLQKKSRHSRNLEARGRGARLLFQVTALLLR